MYCKYCGNEIAEKAVFCVHCGAATDLPSPFNVQPAVQESKKNGFAITGFVLSLVSFAFGWLTYEVLPILGLIFSIIGLVKSKTLGKGKGLSIAGTVISAVAILAIIGVVVYVIVLFAQSVQNGTPPPLDDRNKY